MSEPMKSAIHSAKVIALSAELQLIASQAQDHVQRFGGWQCDFQSAFEEVRARLDEAIKEAEQSTNHGGRR